MDNHYPLPRRTPMEALAAHGQLPPDPATDRMHYASPGPAPWSGPAKRRGLPVLGWVAIGLVGLALMCGSVTLIGSLGADPVAPVASIEPATFPATAKPTTKAPAAAAPTIEDGLYEVGPDIKPGTYRMVAPVTAEDLCYWSKSTDAEGRDIIDNDLAGVGRLQVTLKKGQWFKTDRCGTWARR